MKFNRKVEAAYKFAELCHDEQRYGDAPYTEHLKDVVNLLIIKFNVTDKDILCAAYLHDAMEDTGVNKSTIEDLFGERVGQLVHAVTDAPGKNRKERKAATYPKIKAIPGATQIKLADRIANVEHSIRAENWGHFKMYQKEQPDFAAQLSVAGENADMWAYLSACFVRGEEKINSLQPRQPAKEL